MSGAQGAASAAAIEQEQPVDDGFTPEERAEFDAMRRETPVPDTGAGAQAPVADPAAAAPAAGAQQQPGAEDDDDDDGEGAGAQPPGQNGERPPPRRVNYNKFKRMEERALQAERDRDQFKEQFQRTDERIRMLNEALTPRQQQQEENREEQDPEPDPDKDVFGWIQWSRRKTARLESMITEQNTRTQTRDAETATANDYVQDAQRFAATEPNFVPAYNFLMQSRTAELALYFFDKDITDGAALTEAEQRQILAEIAAEEKELVQTALKNRKSPAQAVYRMARTRGFKPAAPAAGAGDGNGAGNGAAAGQNGAGGAPPARQAAPGSLAAGDGAAAGAPPPRVADEIARIRQGSEAAKSLSQGGGAPPNPLTPEKLANMPQEEFESLMDRLTPAEQRRLMGG